MDMGWGMTVMMIVMIVLMVGGMAWGVLASLRSRTRSHDARPDRGDYSR
jgi:hypothetical protein